MKIRKAEKKDAKKIAELLVTIAHLHHEGRPDIYADGAKYDVKDVEKKIKNKDELILVAVNDDDEVMGYTMSKTDFTKAHGNIIGFKKMYIDDVCVDEKFRKQGVGSALMNATRETAKRDGCHIVELNVWAFNENAVKFYESCGMKKQRIYMEYVLD